MAKKTTPNFYYYWEINASSVWEIAPQDLFTKSRAGNIPYARMFCMYYMHQELELSERVSAGRYGMLHEASIHAEKVIKAQCDVNKIFKYNFNYFLDACKINKHDIPKYAGLDQQNVDNKLISLVNALNTNNKKLVNYIRHNKDDYDISKLFSKILVCEINLNMIKKFLVK